MTRTVTALYDSRSEAELACDRLKSTFETCSTNIIENSDSNEGADGASDSSLTNLYVSDEDRDAYGEGVRRGGFMLCAEVSSDEDADSIIEVLEKTTPVDMDQRQQDWRNEGWQPGSSSGSQIDSGNVGGASGNFDSQSGTRNIGTRDTERGGSSVRSYARDTSAESDSFSGSDSSGTDGNRR